MTWVVIAALALVSGMFSAASLPASSHNDHVSDLPPAADDIDDGIASSCKVIPCLVVFLILINDLRVNVL